MKKLLVLGIMCFGATASAATPTAPNLTLAQAKRAISIDATFVGFPPRVSQCARINTTTVDCTVAYWVSGMYCHGPDRAESFPPHHRSRYFRIKGGVVDAWPLSTDECSGGRAA